MEGFQKRQIKIGSQSLPNHRRERSRSHLWKYVTDKPFIKLSKTSNKGIKFLLSIVSDKQS